MPWIISKIRAVSIGLFILVLAPCFVLTSSAAEESPKAVIQLFYKALRGGKYTEALQYLSRRSQKHIENLDDDATIEELWKVIAPNHIKNATFQTVEVGEVLTFHGEIMCSVLIRFANGGSEKLRIELEQEGVVWKIKWIGKLEAEQSFREYIVSIYRRHFFLQDEFTNYFEILQGGHRVYMSDFGEGWSSFGLAETYPNKKPNKLIAMGKDITGNGIPNLVVREHSGGSQCCTIYHIFEIGQEVRKIAVIKYDPVDFADLDGDSIPEVVGFDSSFSYLSNSDRWYRPPNVILRYQNGAYRIAVDLMHKPAPSREDLARRVQQARVDTGEQAWPEDGRVPDSILNTMLELLYTGHPNLAWQFLNMAWPLEISGKDKWLSKFRATLEDSSYWPLDGKRAYFVP